MSDSTPATAAGQDVLITRIFDAPREDVFRAWTDPDEVAAWFGPAQMETPRERVHIDLRVGGRFELTIPFKEITMENLERAIPGAYISSDGDDPPLRRLDFTVSVGASMRARATKLEIRPIIGGNETADPEEILTIYEASPSGSDVTLAYHPTDQREIVATFRGWPSAAGVFGTYGSTAI